MKTQKPIITLTDKLGIDKMAKALGVQESAIRMAHSRGTYPTAWFDTIESLGKRKRVKVSRDFFDWKSADEKATA